MLIDRIALRPRPANEAMDLGLRLVQARWPAILAASCLTMLPPALVAALAWFWSPLLTLLVLWWSKPLIDRTVLALLAAELGRQPLGIRAAARHGLASGAKTLMLLIRLSWHPARPMVLPVSQLEGLTGTARRQRTSALGRGSFGAAAGLTLMAQLFEICVLVSLLSLVSWLPPDAIFNNIAYNPANASLQLPTSMWVWLAGLYATTIILVEPFYLGAGFGLYLNQRCRLECWDLEFTLRRLAMRHAGEQAA